jgi:hypothetical protein
MDRAPETRKEDLKRDVPASSKRPMSLSICLISYVKSGSLLAKRRPSSAELGTLRDHGWDDLLGEAGAAVSIARSFVISHI